MDSLDPVLLARIQFAANISFHILFPTITIALAWVLLYFKLRFKWSGDAQWMDAYGFWVKVFALSFALGVVSGITMSFQFGTNWPGYMNTVGNIAGPLLAYEVLTAFFLEASFLGIMLFGYRRVSERIHTLSTVLVAVGTSLSAFWILALNSWMHTPVGFEMRDGVAHATDWMAILFNPSMPWRLTHMMLASFLTVAFLMAGLSAWRWLRGDRQPAVMAALRSGVFMAATLIPVQIVVGDFHGLNTLEHQPAKIAAVEAIWDTERGAALTLFGIPDEAARTTHGAIKVPRLAALILTHEWDGEIRGLNEFEGDHPPVAAVFWSFRIMVGIGLLMLAVGWLAAWQMRRGEAPAAWLQRGLVWMAFSGWVAVLAGWYTTEIGRQPWLVYGVLRTADAASGVPAAHIGLSLAMYLTVYALLTYAYVRAIFHLTAKAKDAPSFGQRARAEGPPVMAYVKPAADRAEGGAP
ncbi:MAG TPA: cytochrome ubiquinol oxidase subunit I [Xanthomonadaceae bacterium]|nr:cytochrome ubiquinol oxidase subunit I [Xanthomonadaceae bacterium]